MEISQRKLKDWLLHRIQVSFNFVLSFVLNLQRSKISKQQLWRNQFQTVFN